MVEPLDPATIPQASVTVSRGSAMFKSKQPSQLERIEGWPGPAVCCGSKHSVSCSVDYRSNRILPLRELANRFVGPLIAHFAQAYALW